MTNRRHLALALIRERLRWEQKDLARAAGMRPRFLSDLEAGRRPLSQKKLEFLVGLMGLGPHAIDAAYTFMDDTDPAVGMRAEWMARKAGHAMENFVREVDALCSTGLRAIADRDEAKALWARLSTYSEAKQRTIALKSREFRTWALCELICAESIKAAADDAGRALTLAEFAGFIAELIPGEAAWRWRVQGYCWAHVANAHRVQGQLNEADRAFARAKDLWQAGAPGDPAQLLEEALVLGLEASLLRQHRRMPEALALIERALDSNPEGSLQTQLLLNKANVLKLQGDYQEAISILQKQVAPLVAGIVDPRLLFAHRFSLADNLSHLDRPYEAEALLPELRRLSMEIANDLDQLRVRWLEGRVAAGLGRRQEAIVALARVRQEFGTRAIAYDTALASLELATLHLEAGQTASVRILVREMKPIFESQGVDPEALAALRLFAAAAEQEKVTLPWARSLVRYLYRAQGNPALHFEPPA